MSFNAREMKEKGWHGGHNRHARAAAFWKRLRHRVSRRIARRQLREVVETWA